MEYLIYMSTSVNLMSDAELKSLLRQSQQNNTDKGLSGMLLYSEGTFVQVLEGERELLENTYVKIVGDPRHKGIIKIAGGEIAERVFPHWAMGFKTLSTQQFSKFDAYIHPSGLATLQSDKVHPALTILKGFAESNNL